MSDTEFWEQRIRAMSRYDLQTIIAGAEYVGDTWLAQMARTELEQRPKSRPSPPKSAPRQGSLGSVVS